MSYFRVMPNVLQMQREELENSLRELCRSNSEITAVIRRLRSMSGFEGTVQNLRRIQNRISGQQVRLRQSAIVLREAADCYTRTELKNLDGDSAAANGFGFALGNVIYADMSGQKMIPGAEALFGMKVTIRQRD